MYCYWNYITHSNTYTSNLNLLTLCCFQVFMLAMCLGWLLTGVIKGQNILIVQHSFNVTVNTLALVTRALYAFVPSF